MLFHDFFSTFIRDDILSTPVSIKVKFDYIYQIRPVFYTKKMKTNKHMQQ